MEEGGERQQKLHGRGDSHLAKVQRTHRVSLRRRLSKSAFGGQFRVDAAAELGLRAAEEAEAAAVPATLSADMSK